MQVLQHAKLELITQVSERRRKFLQIPEEKTLRKTLHMRKTICQSIRQEEKNKTAQEQVGVQNSRET